MRNGKSLYYISKGLFSIYFLYSQFLKNVVVSIPHMSQILIVLALVSFLIYKKRITIYKEVMTLFVFGLLTLAMSAFAVDTKIAFTYSQLIIEYVVAIFLIILYSVVDESINFSASLFVILGVIISIWMLMFGVGLNRISFSEDVNVNIVGTILAFSIGYVLFLLLSNKIGTKKVVFSGAIIVLLLFSALSTASKKCLIASAILIIVFILFCYRRVFDKSNPLYAFLITLSLILIAFIAFYYITTQYGDRLLYAQARMDSILEDKSTQKRYDLIIEGLSVFSKNPIFGVGINNFRYYSSFNTYSHCSYTELLACTGLAGTFLFAAPVFSSLKNVVLLGKKTPKKTLDKSRIVFVFFMLLVLLFVCWTQIIIYTSALMYVLGTIIAFVYVEKRKNTVVNQ